MKVRLLLPLLAVALLLGACSDDGGDDTIEAEPGRPHRDQRRRRDRDHRRPVRRAAACADLADRYVRQARRMFDTEGTPSDALVDEVRARLAEFDAIASTAGCGEEYLTGVCEGLDALTQEGLLVILPLTTAQCL